MLVKRLAMIPMVLLALYACTSKPVSQTEPTYSPSNTPLVLPTRIAPSPTETHEPTTIPTKVPPTETPVVIERIDPCKLVLQSSVEAILGEPAQVIRETDMCIYMANSGSLSISVGIKTGEETKPPLLDTIAQLREDCSLRFEYTSAEPTPTPFPSKIQALADLSLQELMKLQDEAFNNCGSQMSEGMYQTIDGLGDSANFMVLDLGWWRVGAVSIAIDGMYLVFNTTTNQDLDRDHALEAGITLAQEALENLQ
jgi:hypothetical protein